MKRNLLVFAILSFFCFGCQSDGNHYPWKLCGVNSINDENHNYPIDGYFNFFDGLDCAKEQNKPILVFFNAFGISTEETVFKNKKAVAILKEHFVPIVLYVDYKKPVHYLDMDKLSETLPMTFASERKIETVGDLNSIIQIELTHSNSQPLMIAMTHDGKLLERGMAYDDIHQFKGWLEKSLANFQAEDYLFDLL